jgi:hypothetical protein
MESLVCVAVWAVTLAMAMASILWTYRWSHPKANGQLPPGSLGFPLLGETLQFFAPNPTSDVSPFVKKRLDRLLANDLLSVHRIASHRIALVMEQI